MEHATDIPQKSDFDKICRRRHRAREGVDLAISLLVMWAVGFAIYLLMADAVAPYQKGAYEYVPWFLLAGFAIVALWLFCRKVAAESHAAASDMALRNRALVLPEVKEFRKMLKQVKIEMAQMRRKPERPEELNHFMPKLLGRYKREVPASIISYFFCIFSFYAFFSLIGLTDFFSPSALSYQLGGLTAAAVPVAFAIGIVKHQRRSGILFYERIGKPKLVSWVNIIGGMVVFSVMSWFAIGMGFCKVLHFATATTQIVRVTTEETGGSLTRNCANLNTHNVKLCVGGRHLTAFNKALKEGIDVEILTSYFGKTVGRYRIEGRLMSGGSHSWR